jgi:hypothetical protein
MADKMRYYYEMPAQGFVRCERDDEGTYTLDMCGCTIYRAQTVVASLETIVIEMGWPVCCGHACGMEQCHCEEITKEVSDG